MNLTRSAFRFVLIGAVSTLIHVLSAVIFIEWSDIGHTPANGLAFLVATLFSYAVNTCWSFEARVGVDTAWRFFLVSGCGGLLTLLIAWLVERAQGPYGLGIGMVVTLVPPATFAGHRLFTYRHRAGHDPRS